ncbi:hypothetical protein M422DRAFT_267118 [Sphaerobolus stellatus SS14]|uniref:Uncharacterized protein n=1 Tax=Sphaerobolus stellatus (strain SS14) TaxID=990650 RepID=A0A0C9UQF2_SPHS4|nr:hypothetical protein M422DRAFT_267118 [Sphaerobolus stellatus SS14]
MLLDKVCPWYDNVSKFVQMGRKEWADVSREIKGEIFEDWFLNTVRKIQLNGYLRALGKVNLLGCLPTKDSSNWPKKKSWSSTAILFLSTSKPTQLQPQLITPISGLSHISCSKLEVGRILPENESIRQEKIRYLLEAGKGYETAGNLFHADDEQRGMFLQRAIRWYELSGTLKVHKALSLIEKNPHCLQCTEPLWANSYDCVTGLLKELRHIVRLEEEIRKGLEKGEIGRLDIVHCPILPNNGGEDVNVSGRDKATLMRPIQVFMA